LTAIKSINENILLFYDVLVSQTGFNGVGEVGNIAFIYDCLIDLTAWVKHVNSV